MNKDKNILVSGIAGDIGFGVGRIIKDYNEFNSMHGIDIHDKHPGAYIFDKCCVAPRADETHYTQWLNDYIQTNNISLFIPTSEAEIHRLSSEKIKTIANATILMSNNQVITNGLDKHACLNFLSQKGISVPENGIVGTHTPKKYPVIVKPRSGQGSKNILCVDNKSEYLSTKIQNLKNSVWQEYLLPDNQEYTCAVYRSKRIKTRIVTIKRQLKGGFTVSGEVIENDEITQYVKQIALAMKLNGAMNIQLRLTSDGPLLFEINPRLSSTLVFRDKMGFCDLRWWLSDIFETERVKYQQPSPGLTFHRGIQEYISSTKVHFK